MTRQEAKKITGNQPHWALRNMAYALSLHPWLNTEEEATRLEAAKFLLSEKEREEN